MARNLTELTTPPAPPVSSPKCPKCSLCAICLPDETNRCPARDGQTPDVKQVRLPATPRDDLRPLYLNTQGLFIGRKSELLQVKDNGKVVQEVRLREINQVNLFGNVQLSTQVMQTMLELEIPLIMFSQQGYFYGMLQGTGLKNILLRREQFRMADAPDRRLQVARSLIAGKIRTQRVMLMRNHISPPRQVITEPKRVAQNTERISSAASLLGIEGTAARLYFQHFAGMLKPGDEPLDPGAALGEPPRFSFDFRGRNRRPPRDPVNAALSLGYWLPTLCLMIVSAIGGCWKYKHDCWPES